MMTTFCGVATAPAGAAAISDEMTVRVATSATRMRFGNGALLAAWIRAPIPGT
jgi:hypothetical protein